MRTFVGANPYGSGAEEGQHREDAAVVVRALIQAELCEYPADVGLDDRLAEHNEVGDGLVGPALCEEGENLEFQTGELVQGSPVAGPLDQAGHDGGVEDAFALVDAADGVR